MIFDLLRRITYELDQKSIEFMVSGSLALTAYITPRFTRDIDIVIELRNENIDVFLKIFEAGFYKNDEAIKHELKRHGMFNILDDESGYKIDFIILKNEEFRQMEFKRKVRKTIFGVETWIVSVEDLIISKLIWIQDYKSELQSSDIRSLAEIPDIDRSYIEEWINKLHLKTYNLI